MKTTIELATYIGTYRYLLAIERNIENYAAYKPEDTFDTWSSRQGHSKDQTKTEPSLCPEQLEFLAKADEINYRMEYAYQRLADMSAYMETSENKENFFLQTDLIAEVFAYTEMDPLLEQMFWDSISWVGTNYSQKGVTKKQNWADCGSFVRALHSDNGIMIKQIFAALYNSNGTSKNDRGTAAMWRWLDKNRSNGMIIHENITGAKNFDINALDVRPMDVIFYDYMHDKDYGATHVGMVLGRDKNGNVVLIETANNTLNLEIIGPDYSSYLEKHYEPNICDKYLNRYENRTTKDIVGIVRYTPE